MESGDIRKESMQDYALAGLETGTLATLAMLVWVGVNAMWYRRSFWMVPNLMASTFYGDRALSNRFTSHTFSGLALFLVIYGLLGLCFGLAMQQRRGGLLVAVGVLAGIAFYYLAFGWALKHWNPWIALYLHERPMLAGHVVYGAMLGCYGRHLRKIPHPEH
jgi:hypothetical protein